MKEEKVGKKPKGMVVVISVGKPGGKKPEREADPDTKKKANSVYDELPYEAFGTKPPKQENPTRGYNRRMLVEGEIPFEDPHMELRLDPVERELDRLQGVRGDSPNIRPRLHPLYGSKIRQKPMPIRSEGIIQRGVPMDFAWRLLKHG